MYKILTRLHTQSPGVFRYHMISDDSGHLMEYQAETLEEVELEVIKILEKVGCYDLRIVEEQPYYIDLEYSEDPDFDGESEGEAALRMLNFVGWRDLRISDNKPFTIELIFGTRPEEQPSHYTLTITAPEDCIVEPNEFTDIVAGCSRNAKITFPENWCSFHMIIDGEEANEGNPSWIEYEPLTNTEGVLTFQGINSDHTIEIVIDRKNEERA